MNYVIVIENVSITSETVLLEQISWKILLKYNLNYNCVLQDDYCINTHTLLIHSVRCACRSMKKK